MNVKLWKKGFVISVIIILYAVSLPHTISSSNVFTEYSLFDMINNPEYLNDIEYYALIIGVEKFDEIEFPENFIDECAISIYEKLLKGKNWKEENIKLLLNENATKEDIKEAVLTWLDDKETENDVVLYFFTGHSWRIRLQDIIKGREGNTVTYPYDATENKITDIELDSWLDELESQHIAIILDTCYSGRMFALIQSNRTMLAAGGKYLFCPVDGDETLENGIFTFHLLQGFDGVADINNDGWVTAQEVFKYARFPTFYFSFWKQYPFFNFSRWPGLPFFIGPQLPYMYDNHNGCIPVLQI